MKSQAVPLTVQLHSAPRIVSLTDRVWFKVKTSDWRGAVTDIRDGAPDFLRTRLQPLQEWWWLAAAGRRQEDSSQHDFYSRLTESAHSAGPHSCSTDFLLPSLWDVERVEAEAAFVAVRSVQTLVRQAARESLTNSDIRGFNVGPADVRVRVRMLDDGQVYLAVGAVGIADPNFFALLFSSFDGIDAEDWLPEPGGNLKIEPAPGEILWSAMMPPFAQQSILS